MHGRGPDWLKKENLPAPPPENLPLQDNNDDRVNNGAGDDEVGLEDKGNAQAELHDKHRRTQVSLQKRVMRLK
ncbi:hypothetical protein PYW08_013560 [Mythimna loreyi]|uniref:Uncharacterized protein n=1 Tax=Mythimna loreyi TaxID=667449 RepID=A0ACC2QIH0_9NEOP|nr:hypothetical protein PYW08_013560 [Mythimna loreyi]